MNEPTEGRILLVGEGNFSFSVSIIEYGTISGPQLTASCIDTFSSAQLNHRSALANIEFLEKAGATVLFEVDATDLHNHPDLKFFEYERVIFNFPLADRHNIKKNRSLLSDFFSSVKNILNTERGQVMITLCKGQGGTPADRPMRSWHDSWQIVSMAANAGFILTDVSPFDANNFPQYESVGFRFQDKSFNTDSALTHVFEIAKSVSVTGIRENKRFIRQGSEDYVVPTYIRRKLERWSLLEKEGHPLCTMSQYISKQLHEIYPHISVLSSNDTNIPQVLTGYKSFVSLETSAGLKDEAAVEDRESLDIDDVDSGDVDSDDVDSGDVHGEGDRTVPAVHKGMPVTSSHTTLITKEIKNVQNLERASRDGEIAGSSLSVTTEYGKEAGKRREQAKKEEVKSKNGVHDRPEQSVSMPVYVVHQRSSVGNVVVGKDFEVTAVETKAANLKVRECGTHQSFTAEAQQQSQSNLLYHLRNSLLENLPDLFNYMKAKAVKAVLMSGIVYCMCSISPFNLAVSHELIFLSKAEMVTGDGLVNHLCFALRAILGKDDIFTIKVNRCPNQTFLLEGGSRIIVASDICVEEEQRCIDLGKVFHWELENPCDRQTQGQPKEATHLNCYVGAILFLDSIAFRALRLPDIRLLWTEDERFSTQFSKSCLSADQKGDVSNPFADFAAFRPFSLYPVCFVHDMSFWENSNRLFEEPEFLEVVREVADDIVKSVSLVEKFENLENGKVSRCYRFVYQSHDRALSYIASWKLQSVVRLKVAQALGVELR